MKLVIFDMDGTILDTLDDLYEATNYVLRYNHFPTRTKEEVRSFVGNGIYRLVQLAAPTICPKPLIDLMFDDFCDYYKDHSAIHTKPYEGIIEFIQILKKHGIKVAVCSNKSDFAVQDLCKQYFDGLFDLAMGSSDIMPKKPAPDMVNAICNQLHIAATDAIYIGDSEVDIETSKNTNIDLILVDWGFRDREVLESLTDFPIVSSTKELESLVIKTTSQWDPIQYEKFLKERTQPSIDLINHIPSFNPKEVIDLGCGPGNSTKLLKQYFPNAHIIGGDVSEEMLTQARVNVPDINFIYFNGSTDFKENSYDLIFSNACIQWIPDHVHLIQSMYQALKKDGILAVQIPIMQELKIQEVLEKLALEKYHLQKREVLCLQKEEYYDLLASLSNQFTIWQTNYMHSMPSIDSLVEWYKGSALRPYLAQLDESTKEVFLKDFADALFDYYPVRTNGTIIFSFPRLFFTIQKA